MRTYPPVLTALALSAAAPAHAGMIDFAGTIADWGPGSTFGGSECPPGHGYFQMFDGVGGIGVVSGASTIGAVEPVHRHCLSPPVAGVRALTQGAFAWDFGGGDVLRGSYAGTVTGAPPVLALAAPLIINGGEGRFRHATGTIATNGDVRPGPVFTIDWRLAGVIDTPAPGALSMPGLGLIALAARRRAG